jgi:hypothetical protein
VLFLDPLADVFAESVRCFWTDGNAKGIFEHSTGVPKQHPASQLDEMALLSRCHGAGKEGSILIEGGKTSPHSVGRFQT